MGGELNLREAEMLKRIAIVVCFAVAVLFSYQAGKRNAPSRVVYSLDSLPKKMQIMIRRDTASPNAFCGDHGGPDCFQVELISEPKICYPRTPHVNEIEGNVVAEFVVNIDGLADMSTFTVISDSGHRDFVRAVREGLATVLYYTAERIQYNGRIRIPMLVQQPFIFEIMDKVEKSTPPHVCSW